MELKLTTMKCEHCFHEIYGVRHKTLCPYRPENVRKIVMFLRDYLLKNSKFNKNFCPFPSPRELDMFCRRNRIARVKTIANRYLDKETKITDWLTEILDLAIADNIVGRDEFPSYLLFIYDAWIFYSKEEYQRMYEESIIYEDGEPLTKEILSAHHTSSAIIQRLRTQGKMFTEEQTPIEQFLA